MRLFFLTSTTLEFDCEITRKSRSMYPSKEDNCMVYAVSTPQQVSQVHTHTQFLVRFSISDNNLEMADKYNRLSGAFQGRTLVV